MSSESNSTCTPVSLSDAEIMAIKTGFYLVATSFVLWGLQIALVSHAVYLLWNRGLRNSRSRQCMIAIVLIMLASRTTEVILILEFNVVQVPFIGLHTPADIARQMADNDIGRSWISRLDFCLSDIIVVWRAWVLWPRHRTIQWTLGVFMGVTLVCTTVNVVLTTVQDLRLNPDAEYSGRLYPPSALRAMLYIPLLTTNVLATTLIVYKAWLCRQDIRMFATDTNSSSSKIKSSVRLDRVFALFIETGVLYVVLFLFNFLSTFGVFDRSKQGYEFNFVWNEVIDAISCIYPTIVIIFVSIYMSQSDVVLSTLDTTHGRSIGSPKPDHVDVLNGNRTLSTIQFDLPPLPASAYSSAHDKERSASPSVD